MRNTLQNRLFALVFLIFRATIHSYGVLLCEDYPSVEIENALEQHLQEGSQEVQ